MQPTVTITGGKRIGRIIRRAKQGHSSKWLHVGFFESARYRNGIPVAQVAVENEFGVRTRTQRVPERPFFRNALDGADKDLRKVVMAKIDRTTLKVDRSMAEAIGLAMQARIQKSITVLRKPPNAPATIAMKGSDNPLIDTGFMRQSVTYRHGR